MPFNELGEWKPNQKQSPFLALPCIGPGYIKEGFYGGGAGSGKSDVLLLYGIVHRWHENPRFKQVFQRRTFPELRNEIIPRSREYYRPFGAKFNSTEMCWTFPREDQYGSGERPDGAKIFLGHCENEDDVHQYDSMEINLYTPDELTSYTYWIYSYIGFQRVRTSDPKLPAIIRAAGMPGNIGHGWVYERFIKPYKKGGVVLVGKGGVKRIFIHATQADNKEHIDPNYAQSLEALPEAERRAKLHGDWDAYLGQVFNEFRDRHYVDEPDNALHVIEPREIPDWWPRIVNGDWGFRAQTYVTYSAISPDGQVFVYREQSWRNTKIEEWMPYVKENIEKENPKIIRFCKSIGYESGQEHTIQQQIETALGRSVDLFTNTPGSRVAGKQLLHEYLRWKSKKPIAKVARVYNEEYALWTMRNRGEKFYKAYLDSFKPVEEEKNLPKLQIFCCDDNSNYHIGHDGCCPILISTIKQCNYAKAKKDGLAVEDVAEFDGDDAYDTIRDVVDCVDKYVNDAMNEFDKVKKRNELQMKLRESNDWTAYYRNSERMESAEKHFSIPRFHRRRR